MKILSTISSISIALCFLAQSLFSQELPFTEHEFVKQKQREFKKQRKKRIQQFLKREEKRSGRKLKFLNAKQSLQQDLRILAKELGLPIAEVKQQYESQQKFSNIANRIYAKYPNLVAGIWTDPIPNTRGHIRFVGKIPEDLNEFLNSISDGEIDFSVFSETVLLKDGKVSSDEQRIRVQELAKVLSENGHRNISTYYDNKKPESRIRLLS